MKNIIKQILIGSALGDGHFTPNGTFNTGSKYKEWVDFKLNILKNYVSPKAYYFVKKNGYNQNPYHTMRTLVHPDIKLIGNMSLSELLNNLDETGLAVWMYDDGSLHKSSYFYNLCTHSFTYQEHIQCIIPTLARFGILAKVLKEEKKDGRIFYYTYIPKKTGAEIINRLLKKYPMPCYKYKTYSGNINDTLTRKFVKTTHIKTGKIIIHKGIYIASKYIKFNRTKVKESILNKTSLGNFIVEYYYYE